MQIPYFKGLSWRDITREERFYCFCLYLHARSDPGSFADWVNQTAQLNIDTTGVWDLGIEVCLYRDLLWHKGTSVHGSGFSPKRTFDLCLFGSKAILIIEAKVYQPFNKKQSATFARDSEDILKLLKSENLKVFLVALASSRYLASHPQVASGQATWPFHGQISWADAYEEYGDALLQQADDLYHSHVRKLQD